MILLSSLKCPENIIILGQNSDMESYASKIEERISHWKKGKIFFPLDFSDIAQPQTVRKTLTRLCDDKTIVRLGRGIFCIPKVDEKWGTGLILPSLEEIAAAVAKCEMIRIAPTGAYALNALGLSTQVSTNIVYVTDGAPRKINIGNGRGITFKHTSDVKLLSFKSELMSLIVASIKEMGEGCLTEKQISIIKEHLAKVEEEDFRHDVKLAPEWVRKQLFEL